MKYTPQQRETAHQIEAHNKRVELQKEQGKSGSLMEKIISVVSGKKN
jgi:hypothetical protein